MLDDGGGAGFGGGTTSDEVAGDVDSWTVDEEREDDGGTTLGTEVGAGGEADVLDTDSGQLDVDELTIELRDSQMVRIDVSKSRDALFLVLNCMNMKENWNKEK